MIIKGNKDFEMTSGCLNSDWYGEGNYIIDETNEEGRQMAQLYIDNYPFVDFEVDGQRVTKVMILNKPDRPVPNESQEVQLVQNEPGEWGYVLVDKPLSEIDLLKLQLTQQQILMDTILGVSE